MGFRPGQLRHLVVVAEEGQMTRAAARLGIAQPALSQSIAALESELGFQVFERRPRGVKLTPAGEAFIEKAARAVQAEADAAETARWLGRSSEGTIEFGFVGTPPGLDSPRPLERFAQRNPGIDLRFRELAFPCPPTSSWLAEVDVAVCHAPPADPQIWARVLRSEPRAVLAAPRHPLAERSELAVEEILEETFLGLHPAIDPSWAGFWSLDDHRGGPPLRVTPDNAANPHEVVAALAVRSALTTAPESVAGPIMSHPSGVVAIPLRGADPVLITLVGHEDLRNHLVATLLEFIDLPAKDPVGWPT